MPLRPVPDKFSVAFSFSGKERKFVAAIAEALETRLGIGTVFLDEWFEHLLAGHSADLKLQRIYGSNSELVVVCVSKSYNIKPWTQMEHEVIRSRMMRLAASKFREDQYRILPIRVGNGDVGGIHFNTIVPDVRRKTVEQTLELILARLNEILPKPKRTTKRPVPRDWPATAIAFTHELADRDKHEWPEILKLFLAGAQFRLLIFSAPSGFSKTALLNAAANYLSKLNYEYAYVNFASEFLTEAHVLRQFQTSFAKSMPSFANSKSPNRWSFTQALRQLDQPIAIVLDSYEKAKRTERFAEWLESYLLTQVQHCPKLRIIAAGQEGPEGKNYAWSSYAKHITLWPILDKVAWRTWVHRINPAVNDQQIEAVVFGCDGHPANISMILRTYADKIKTIS